MVLWSYFDKFEPVLCEYMPMRGEGDSVASQIATAVNKLVYKWYNDGDVYDNRYCLNGWCNDLSSYANWLYKYASADELRLIADARSNDDYEEILASLAETFLDREYLEARAHEKKVGSIYKCDGPFKFVELSDEDEDWDEEDEWEDDEVEEDW